MKKILGIILICILALSFNIKVKAAEPTISVSDVKKAKAGDEVKVDFSFSDNPGIAAFTITVDYDETVLELKEINHSGISSGTWMISDDNISWFSFGDSKYNGKFATAVFKIKEDAPSGKSDVSISYRKGNICNFDEQIVDFKVQKGCITIKNSKEDNSKQEKETKQNFDVNKNSDIKSSKNNKEKIEKEDNEIINEIEQKIEKASAKYEKENAKEDNSTKQSSSLLWLWILIGVVVILVVLYFAFRDKIDFLRRKK